MVTYSFLTTDSFRIDVDAKSPQSGYSILKKKYGARLTKAYIRYGKDGFQATDWQTVQVKSHVRKRGR